MIDRAVLAVLSAAFVAVTYAGKRGFVAFGLFNLPLAVIFLILQENTAGFIGFLLLFLCCNYILVKRHYLLKRTTAGLLKDRQT